MTFHCCTLITRIISLFDKIRKGSDLMLDIGMEGICREYENL